MALEYRRKGFSVIPLESRGKKPLIKWSKYQTVIASEQEIINWWSKWANANIGIVTGKISGVAVVDIEKGGSTDGLPITITVKTGGGGFHLYYKYPKCGIGNATRIKELTDIRGDGGYVVAPPSMHKSGEEYTSIEPIDKEAFAEFPMSFFEVVKTQSNNKGINLTSAGVEEGQRNTVATQMTGSLLSRYPKKDWNNICWSLLSGWNTLNKPPLDVKELRSVFESIKKLQTTNKQHASKSVQIMEWRQFDKIVFPKERWLVENLLPINSFSFIAAPSGSKKTWLAMEMARSIALGIPFLNHSKFKTKKSNVLYIEPESPQHETQRRGRQLGLNKVTNMWVWCFGSVDLSDEKVIVKLGEFIKTNDISVVFVDTLRSVSGGLKENEGDMVRVFFNNIKEIRDGGVTFVFLDHTRKMPVGWTKRALDANDLIGSQDKRAAVENVSMVRSVRGSNYIEYHHVKSKTGLEYPPFKVLIEDAVLANGETITTLSFDSEIDERESAKELAKKLVIEHLANVDEECTAKELKTALTSKVGNNAVDDALKELCEQEEVVCKKTKPYTYWVVKGESSAS